MKTCFKNLLIVISMAVIFAIGGCQQNSITPEKVQQIAAEVNSLNDQATAYQQQAVLIAQGMVDANIVDPKIMAKVNQLNTEADKVRAKIAVLTAALQSVKLTGDNNQDLLTLLQQLNAASSPFNPYAAPAAGILAIISLILTAIAKKKAAEAAQSSKALDEVVTANEFFLNKSSSEVSQAFKDIQNQLQTAETNKKVAAIKAS